MTEQRKRWITLGVGLLLTLAIGIGLLVVGGAEETVYGTPGEDFVGYLSTQSYRSIAETAKAFCENEMTSARAESTYLGYVQTGEMTEEELDALPLEEDERLSVESGEYLDVYYSRNGHNGHTGTCLLRTADGFRYYSAMPSIGAPLTNAYFASVFDGEKYLNSTSAVTLSLRMVNGSTNVDATYRQQIMLDGTLAYVNQGIPGLVSELYFEESYGDGITVYLKHPLENDGGFYSLSQINRELASENLEYTVSLIKGGEQVDLDTLDTMSDVAGFMFAMDPDPSYFVKTAYGFAMSDEGCLALFKSMMSEEAYGELEQTWEKYRMHFNSAYYVTEGRLSASKAVITMSDGEDLFALTVNASYTDFGTTEVELPVPTED